MEAEFSVHTDKNKVDIRGDRVIKTFNDRRTRKVRFRREVKALRRLAGSDVFPALLEIPEDGRTFVISRIPGIDLTSCPSPPDSCFTALRAVIEEMLRRGVSRHHLPPRDVIVRPDGSAGLVDFERVTLRTWRFSPIWIIARKITRYHLLRLLENLAPHLLTPEERQRLGSQRKIRNIHYRFIELRRRVRRWWRARGSKA